MHVYTYQRVLALQAYAERNMYFSTIAYVCL